VVVERVISERSLQNQQTSFLSMKNSYKLTKEKEFKKKLNEIALLRQQLSRQKESEKHEIAKKKELVKAAQKEMQDNLSKIKRGQVLHSQTVNLKKIDLDKMGYSHKIDETEHGDDIDGRNIELNESLDSTLDDYYDGINLTELRKDINIGISKPNYNVKDPVSYKNTAKTSTSKEIHALAWNTRAPEVKTLASGFRVASPPSSRKSRRQDSAPAGLDSISLHSQANCSVQSSKTDYSLNIDVLAKKLIPLNNAIEYFTDTQDFIPLHVYVRASTDIDQNTADPVVVNDNSSNIVIEGDQEFDDSLVDLTNSQVTLTHQNSFITASGVEMENVSNNIVKEVTNAENSVPTNPASITDSLDYVINAKLTKKKKEISTDTQSIMKQVNITQADPTVYIKSSTTVKRGLTKPQAKTIQGRYRSGTYKPSILEIAASDPFKKPFM